MEKIITGTRIVKTYGNTNESSNVLDGVNLELLKGEFVAVMGPSGCGKSTLLFALSGTDSITGGSIRFGDRELSEMKENELADIRRTRMGFVFQQPTMLKNLNIIDNIILPSAQNNKKGIASLTEKARELMKKTGIDGLEERDITEVSGGQLQRAGICRALMGVPDIIFADEPTGALNSRAAEEIMELLTDINGSGTAIFLVTHDAKVAARANRVLFMKDGQIVSKLHFGTYDSRKLESRTEQVIGEMRAIDI